MCVIQRASGMHTICVTVKSNQYHTSSHEEVSGGLYAMVCGEKHCLAITNDNR